MLPMNAPLAIQRQWLEPEPTPFADLVSKIIDVVTVDCAENALQVEHDHGGTLAQD